MLSEMNSPQQLVNNLKLQAVDPLQADIHASQSTLNALQQIFDNNADAVAVLQNLINLNVAQRLPTYDDVLNVFWTLNLGG